MIAPSVLPAEYQAWNSREGAPFGRRIPKEDWAKRILPGSIYQRLRGPFGVQPNNKTREFEYPWAISVAELKPGMQVLEIGGGLAGFQFVLDRAGCKVVNVDPGLGAEGIGWKCDVPTMHLTNRLFKTSVELRNTTIDHANLQPESFDRAFSISVIEHLREHELASTMQGVYASLKHGGKFILTVDLSLNLVPFTSRQTNQFGINMNIKKLIEQAPFQLELGNPSELYGYPNFDPESILSNLERYFIGAYPALVQCFVLVKT